MILYFVVFFHPITYKAYDMSYLKQIKNHWLPKAICFPISQLISKQKKYCYPRLIVKNEVIAKFSPEAFYVPRLLSMTNTKEELKEKEFILSYGKRIDLSSRNLRYADLQNNILTRANMSHSKFDGAKLRYNHMQAVDLTDASFIDADLRRTKLQSAIFINTNLYSAYLIRASLQHANITGTVFENSDLTGANLSDVYFHVILDKRDDNYFLQGLPSFTGTKMLGVNISKYKKQDSNSTKNKNTILFELNNSIYPVVFDVNTSKKYPIILSDKNIFRKYPDLFDENISKRYPLLVDTNVSKE